MIAHVNTQPGPPPPRTAADSCALPTRRDVGLVGGSGPGEPPACGGFAPLRKQPGTRHACATHRAQMMLDFQPVRWGTLFFRHPCSQAHHWDGSSSPRTTEVSKCVCLLTPGRGGSSLPQALGNDFLLRLQALDLGEIPLFPCPGGAGERRGAGAGGQQRGEPPGQSPPVRFASADVLCVCTLHRCCS